MIRFNFAYCPCCVQKLRYHALGNYFYCECDGWLKLDYYDRQKELDAAELYDRRFIDRTYWREHVNAKKS